MNILITGGTGFLGSALTKILVKQEHVVSVLSRSPDKIAEILGSQVNAISSLAQLKPEDNYQIIINLAGAPIFDARWSESRKQLLRESRIKLTQELVACISRMTVTPELLISGSAIGYYGNQGDTVLTEQTTPYTDFSQQLCVDWEAAANRAEQFGTRVCLIRTGLVIDKDGGFLQKMLLPFRLGLGGRLGEGKQWMSWIHRQDWVNIVLAMIADSSMHGPYNATAPNPVTNAEFTHLLAQCLKRPALLPVPAAVLRVLLGEMSQLVLGSQRVIPERLLSHGFKFDFDDLATAFGKTLV